MPDFSLLIFTGVVTIRRVVASMHSTASAMRWGTAASPMLVAMVVTGTPSDSPG
jgi:hypothetical protein